MKDKVVVITGATTGLSKATAIGLAKMGATLVLVGGDRGQLSSLAEVIFREAPHTVPRTILADHSSMAEVRRSASEIISEQRRINILINNVGTVAHEREVTVDGYERTFALNHLAPFLLTNLLLSSLRASAPSRIITASSTAHTVSSLDLDDLMLERGYSPFRASGQAKLANMLFTCELAQRLQGTGVTANFVDAGKARTRFCIEAGALMRLDTVALRSLELRSRSGARTSIHLASSREVEGLTGQCFTSMRPSKPNPACYDTKATRILWDISERLTGLGTG